MSHGDYAKVAAEMLAKASEADAVAPNGLGEKVDASSALIAAMQSAVLASAAGARRARWMKIAALAASVPIVALGASSLWGGQFTGVEISVANVDGEVAVSTKTDATDAAKGVRLLAGSEIRSMEQATADLVFSTGTRMHLSEETRLVVVDQTRVQRFRLRAGAVFARVAKLHKGERFLIETHDTTVEVRGTSFEVSLAKDSRCKDGLATRVRVEEGTVSVTADGNEVPVHRGETWTAACAAEVRQATAVVPAVVPAVMPVAPAPLDPSEPASHPVLRPSHSVAQVREPAPSRSESDFVQSSLAIQNDAFAEAIQLRRSGDLRAAKEKFDAFLRSYPSSPLRESVMIERMKVLGALRDPSAQRAARDYLDAFPNGLGRSVARSYLGSE